MYDGICKFPAEKQKFLSVFRAPFCCCEFRERDCFAFVESYARSTSVSEHFRTICRQWSLHGAAFGDILVGIIVLGFESNHRGELQKYICNSKSGYRERKRRATKKVFALGVSVAACHFSYVHAISTSVE